MVKASTSISHSFISDTFIQKYRRLVQLSLRGLSLEQHGTTNNSSQQQLLLKRLTRLTVGPGRLFCNWATVSDWTCPLRLCLWPIIAFLGYLLLGLISAIVFRAVRDALPNDKAAQERIVGASLTALALADVSLSPLKKSLQAERVVCRRLHSASLSFFEASTCTDTEAAPLASLYLHCHFLLSCATI